MSDFDNFDDLDAVRDFRSGVGLMTPEVDERIRRRIIDLAIARRLADGTRYAEPELDGADDLDLTDDRPLPPIVLDLPEEGSEPHAPAASSGVGSSDGSAASVVELQPAARPPVRQPRVLVAAAAILVLLLAVGVVASRRIAHSDLDTAAPPTSAGSNTSSGVTTTTIVTSLAGLKAMLGSQAPTPLVGNAYVRTVDRRSDPSTDPARPGSFTYTVTQERTADGYRGSTGYVVSAGTLSFNGTTTSSQPPEAKPSPDAFSGFAYRDVSSWAGLDAAQLRDKLRNGGAETYQTLSDALNLLRLPVFTGSLRAGLLDAITTGTFVEQGESVAGDELQVVLRSTTAAETITIKVNAATGVISGWDHVVGGQQTNAVEVLEPPVVTP